MSGRAQSGKAEVHYFPVRHHSPTCAFALGKALDEIRPSQVLVEAPVDFEPLIPALTDTATHAPVAIVSLDEGPGQGSGAALYPFCDHSPELAALRWAHQAGARAALIDLPARHEAMRARLDGDVQGPLLEDQRLDYNRYVAELCARRGMPDGAALWDALFESQGPDVAWRAYFSAVGVYCEHVRAVTTEEDMARDGTHAREAHMAACLTEAIAAGGPIAIVTGGFHTPALRSAANGGGSAQAAGTKAAKVAPGGAYLIRYGFQQLDRSTGYGAGLPHPGWYDRLWKVLSRGQDPRGLALDVLTEFAAHLRAEAPGLALSTPNLTEALLVADRLAMLRDLPFAGRGEVLDAIRSAGVKDAIEADRTPLLRAAAAFMTGDAIGDLPPGAAQPPIVEAVRAQARALGFSLEGGQKRTRDLDVLRKPRHAQASRFLFALDLADAQFASRISGPDPINGWREDALFETWSYAWSPLVESRLIGRAADGQTLEALCRAELRRRRAALADRGLARSAGAAAGLLIAAARAGFDALSLEVLGWCEEAFAEDPDFASIVRALSLTAGIAAAEKGALGAACAAFRIKAFERLVMLCPHLGRTPPDRLPDLVRSLADLAALASDDDVAVDRAGLAGAMADLPSNLPPALDGALAAFAGLIGTLDEEEVARRVETALDGTYVEVGARAAALTGCLTVSPRLLVHSTPLLAATDRFLAGLDNEGFLQVLPELRLALANLSPSEIDRVADWVASHHGLSAHALASDDIPAAEVAANLLLSDRLDAVWRADGLDAWLEGRS